MTKKESHSFRLLVGSMLLSILVLSVIWISREPKAGATPKPTAVALVDIGGYCKYNPDWPVFLAGDEIVQHPLFHTGPDGPGTTDGYEILLPRVDRPATIYNKPDHMIPLKRGDVVMVDACGCVQTGGVGDTWKLYVNPTGKDSDKYYHGVILIPNAASLGVPISPTMKNFVRIDELIKWQRRSENNRLHITENSYLTLGYEDTDHTDNGYYRHDDGNDAQCKNVGGAAVSIIIYHH
jgi:hypothetical protein